MGIPLICRIKKLGAKETYFVQIKCLSFDGINLGQFCVLHTLPMGKIKHEITHHLTELVIFFDLYKLYNKVILKTLQSFPL